MIFTAASALCFTTFLQWSVQQVHPFLLHHHHHHHRHYVQDPPQRQQQVQVSTTTSTPKSSSLSPLQSKYNEQGGIRIRQLPLSLLFNSDDNDNSIDRTLSQHLNAKATDTEDFQMNTKAATTMTTVQHRLNLQSQFHRWKILQDILEEEEVPSARDINELLHLVLKSFMDNPRPRRINVNGSVAVNSNGNRGDADTNVNANDDSMDMDMKTNPSPFLNDEQCELLQNVLFEYDDCDSGSCSNTIGLIHAIPTTRENGIDDSGDYDDEKIVKNNEILDKYFQPDRNEDEDAFKSCWDVVMELYGREATKHSVQSGDRSWIVRSGVVRLLLHYDFLTDGLGEDVIISTSTGAEE